MAASALRVPSAARALDCSRATVWNIINAGDSRLSAMADSRLLFRIGAKIRRHAKGGHRRSRNFCVKRP